MVGYHQTNQKTDTGKTLTRWPVFVDHYTLIVSYVMRSEKYEQKLSVIEVNQ